MPANIEFWTQLFVTSAATLLAAYGGAKYAFSIQNKRNDEQRSESNITNGNLALFTLIRYNNKFLSMNSQMIGNMRDHPHRHHFIKPSLITGNEPPKFDYPSLSFLLNSHPNLLGRISILEHDIAGTFEVIEQRSRIHFEQLQPVVEELERSLAPDSQITVEQVEAILGTRTTTHLISSTDFMVRGIERAIENTKDLSVQLGHALKEMYPRATIIKIVE